MRPNQKFRNWRGLPTTPIQVGARVSEPESNSTWLPFSVPTASAYPPVHRLTRAPMSETGLFSKPVAWFRKWFERLGSFND